MLPLYVSIFDFKNIDISWMALKLIHKRLTLQGTRTGDEPKGALDMDCHRHTDALTLIRSALPTRAGVKATIDVRLWLDTTPLRAVAVQVNAHFDARYK
jgi:hypothetical protein